MAKKDDGLMLAAQLQRQRNYREAARLYGDWLSKVPRSSKNKRVRDVAYSFGVLNGHLGDLSAALKGFERAIETDAAMWQASLGLGRVYAALGRPVLAMWTWQKALDEARAQPQTRQGQMALLNALAELLESSEPMRALALLEESLAMDTQQTLAVERYLALRRRQCLWPVIPQWLADACPGQDLVFHLGPDMVMYEDCSPADKTRVVKHFLNQKPVPATVRSLHGRKVGGGRVRLAYVVGDGIEPELAEWLLAQVQAHDRRAFDVYVLHNASGALSPAGRQLLQRVDLHVPIAHLSDEQVASRVRELKVDVLINPMGIHRGARWGVYAHQAAPMQLAYGDRLGMECVAGVTHVLVDHMPVSEVDAPGRDSSRPKLLPVDTLYAVTVGSPGADRRVLRQSAGIADDAFVFGVGSPVAMIGAQAWGLWMRLLRSRPEGVLWLCAPDAQVREELRRRAEELGVDRERIRFADVEDPNEWGCVAVPDVYVDTFPCSMGVMSLKRLAAGVPVLTCAAYSANGHAAAVHLRAAGLGQWVASGPGELLNLAQGLASDAAALTQAYEALEYAQRHSRLFDVPGAVAALETELKRAVLTAGA